MQEVLISDEPPRRSALGRILDAFLERQPDRNNLPAAAPRQAEGHVAADVTNSEDRAGDVERQYPIRIKLMLPEGSNSLDQIEAWLTDKIGADGWAMLTTGIGRSRGLALYLLDPMLAGAFVARWCATDRVEATEGVFRIRDAEPPIELASRRQKKPAAMLQLLAPAA
jgi:hypothetical protein